MTIVLTFPDWAGSLILVALGVDIVLTALSVVFHIRRERRERHMAAAARGRS